jgi:hypothetical protein
MTNPTLSLLGEWSPFEGHSCSPGSCDCETTMPDETLSLLESTAPWLDLPLGEEVFPYVPPALQAR